MALSVECPLSRNKAAPAHCK